MGDRVGGYGFEDGEELAVAVGGQGWDGAVLDFGLDALDEGLFEGFGHVGGAEGWPEGGDGDVLHEVFQAAGAAGQVEGEDWAHEGPAEAGALGDGGVDVGHVDDALFDEVGGFSPEGGLEPVADVAGHFLLEVDGVFAD